MEVYVRLLGFLSSFSGGKLITLKLDSESLPTISSCLMSLNKMLGNKFASAVLDNVTDKPKTLILKNDVEISVLQKLETELNNGDTVIIIPVSHGG